MKIRYLRLGEIPLIEADNGLGLRVLFSSYGASIYAIFFEGKIMTLTAKHAKDFARKDNYYGKTVGPIAGRVKDGLVEIDGKEFFTLLNEGSNTLHGGDYACSRFLFSSKITNNNQTAFSIRYKFLKRDMKDGLPGRIEYIISYYLSAKENLLLCDMRAIPDKETVLALTNHSYFCLGEESLQNIALTFPSNKFVHPDENTLLPLEERDIIPCLDFNKRKLVMKDIDDPYLENSRTKGYDHFLFKKDIKDIITLESGKVRLEISSNFEGAQIYSDNYEDNADVVNTKLDKVRRAIAIEPMDNPLNRKTTKKKETYHREIIYKFFKK